jgi:hypothetical protein
MQINIGTTPAPYLASCLCQCSSGTNCIGLAPERA